jgi:hypothetical protein
MSIRSRESGVLVSTPAWLLNPQDELSRAKRTLDLHGYYAVKKDRVKKLTTTASVSQEELALSRPGLDGYVKRRMFHNFAYELGEIIPVTETESTGEHEPFSGPIWPGHIEYRASVDIILPRKD